MNGIRYCIAETLRVLPMSCVRIPPYLDIINKRSEVFLTLEEAEKAAIIASNSGVEYSVLQVVGLSYCEKCCGEGRLMPKRVRTGEVMFFSEWVYDICDDCEGKGYIVENK